MPARPHYGPSHRAAAESAKQMAKSADVETIADRLRMYAEEMENDYGRAHAPQWMREAGSRCADASEACPVKEAFSLLGFSRWRAQRPGGGFSRPASTNKGGNSMPAELILKWGNVKGWEGFKEGTPAWAALEAYVKSDQGLSAMQRQTPEQRELICALIDAVDGEIHDDWNGGVMTKDAAKDYVRNYGR